MGVKGGSVVVWWFWCWLTCVFWRVAVLAVVLGGCRSFFVGLPLVRSGWFVVGCGLRGLVLVVIVCGLFSLVGGRVVGGAFDLLFLKGGIGFAVGQMVFFGAGGLRCWYSLCWPMLISELLSF